MSLPNLCLPKSKLDVYDGEVGERVKCDFSDETLRAQGKPLLLE
jgi:hypothetical protein